MTKRSYKITFCLKEGYTAKGRHHTLDFAEKVLAQWMDDRLKDGAPVVSGLLQLGTLIYPAVKDEQRNGRVTTAKSAIFAGGLSSKKDMARTDKEVKSTLESLAHTIKEALKQEAVFIIYKDQNWSV